MYKESNDDKCLLLSNVKSKVNQICRNGKPVDADFFAHMTFGKKYLPFVKIFKKILFTLKFIW
jgi:hypothetical protein